MNTIAFQCAALLGLLLFGLGLAISAERGRSGCLIGYDSDPTNRLHKLVRAHGNTAEYVPFLAVLMFFFGLHGASRWVEISIVAVTACRFVFVAGMLLPATLAKPNPMRFVGAAGTYFFGIALSLALFSA